MLSAIDSKISGRPFPGHNEVFKTVDNKIWFSVERFFLQKKNPCQKTTI